MNFPVLQDGIMYKINKTRLCKVQKTGNKTKKALTSKGILWYAECVGASARVDACLFAGIVAFLEQESAEILVISKRM